MEVKLEKLARMHNAECFSKSLAQLTWWLMPPRSFALDSSLSHQKPQLVGQSSVFDVALSFSH